MINHASSLNLKYFFMYNMDNLNIMQINIKSINNKKDLLEIYLDKNDIHIVLLSETWIKNDCIPKLKNYNLLMNNRDDGYGGVAIAIAKHIHFDSTVITNYNKIETIATTINNNNNKITLLALYIPPSLNITQIRTGIKNIVNKYERCQRLILGGDINAHNSLWENYSINDRKGNIISDLISNSNLMVLNTGEHTYQNLAKNYTSAIDISITSPLLYRKCKWETDYSFTTDHIAIKITVENFLTTPPTLYKTITNHKKNRRCSHINHSSF